MSKTVYYVTPGSGGFGFSIACSLNYGGNNFAQTSGSIAIVNSDPAGWYNYRHIISHYNTLTPSGYDFGVEFNVYQFTQAQSILGGSRANLSVTTATIIVPDIYIDGLVYLYSGLNWLGLIITSVNNGSSLTYNWTFNVENTRYYCTNGLSVTVGF